MFVMFSGWVFYPTEKQPATGFWQVKASLFEYLAMTPHVK
jgi:hypothetical protein